MTEQSTVLLRIEDIDQAFLPGGSFDPQSENHYDLVIEKFKQDYSADGFFIDVQFDGLVVQISPNSEAEKELNDCIELLQLGGFQPAIHRLNPLLKKHPYNINLLYNYGMALREVGDVEQSIEILKKATNVSPNHVHARVALAVSYQTIGDQKKSLKAAQQALQIDDEDPYVLRTIGYILESSGETDDAKGYLEKALTLIPNDPQIHLTLGKIKSATDSTAAKNHFKHVTNIAPGTSLSAMAEQLSASL